ncbi:MULTISPECIES: hypothetical protein [unclassified Paraburkholderia]|uniref:hypothetical protein n=1 Tax=unclassified Paraburkholderia TaxID=2615204 RepID=UPI00161CE2DA|nr:MULTISPECIES: hypothetical protein [unclassified Paraburkholderia]MBB5441853.1 hypothetical protein [Paraburkholderia sp. WSM4177]MBB5482249.1 hypothetical protein [Paraburkholderia sp. WSM4180]
MSGDRAARIANAGAHLGAKAGAKLRGARNWQIVLAVHVFDVSPRRVYDGLHYDV